MVQATTSVRLTSLSSRHIPGQHLSFLTDSKSQASFLLYRQESWHSISGLRDGSIPRVLRTTSHIATARRAMDRGGWPECSIIVCISFYFVLCSREMLVFTILRFPRETDTPWRTETLPRFRRSFFRSTTYTLTMKRTRFGFHTPATARPDPIRSTR